MMKQKTKNAAVNAVAFAFLAAVAMLFFMMYKHYYRAAYPLKYEEYVYKYSRAENISPALVFAVIRTESGFRPTVESSVGARGLMQITEDTFNWVNYRTGKPGEYKDIFDPEINIEYGAALLRLLSEEFNTAENALCAYHAGWGSVTQWLNNPEYSADGKRIDNIPFSDTKKYVSKVIETWDFYKMFYNIT